jgi:tetratricopeptide (TPR) repeat protein
MLTKLNNRQLLLILLTATFLLFANTLNNQYALDDAIVITENEFVKQGFNGIDDILSTDAFTGFFGRQKDLVTGGRYRPLSLITFAIEHQLWGEKPWLSHLINVLLFMLVVWLIWKVIYKLLCGKFENNKARSIAFLTALIFAAHPIHTEAVANIKGRDEILTFLFSLVSWHLILQPKQNSLKYIVAAFSFFLALMAKENAIAFLAIIPVSLWFFTTTNKKKLCIHALGLFLASIAFLSIRQAVLGGFQNDPGGELMNNPFLAMNNAEKYATTIFTWLVYLKLLVLPHPLTFDYYPYQIPITDFSSPWVCLMLVLLIIGIAFTITGLKQKNIFAFAFIAYWASFSVVSNLLFSVGTFMNERFVFISSLFFILWAVNTAFHFKWINKPKTGLPILLLILLLFSIKTISRNTVWKNDYTLFTTDVKVSSNSAKSNCSAGGNYWEKAKETLNKNKQKELYTLSEKHLRKSLEIHPNYVDAWLLLGNVLFDAKTDIFGSANCYQEVLKRQPANNNAWKNIDIVLQNSENRKLQVEFYQKLLSFNQEKYIINYRLGVLYGRHFGDLEKGVHFLEKATALNPKQVEALKDLGTAYGMSNQTLKAYETFSKALAIEKNDKQIYINLGIAARQLGKTDEANKYFTKANTLQKQQP